MAGTSPANARTWVAHLREWAQGERLVRRRHARPVEPRATAPHGPRRRTLVIAALAVLLAYPVLGTLALWTGLVERLVHSEDLRVEIDNPAYTIWPGHVHLKHARVLVNGDTQFILEGDDLVAHIELFSLLERVFHVTKISGQGVRYQMRTQVESQEGIEERIAAFPPLGDLPGAKLVREKTAAEGQRGKGYTVEIEGIDVRVDELWFFEYRYLGEGRLRGAFVVGPDVMQVRTAVQDIGPGELCFGAEQTVAKNLRGQVTADIPRVNPGEHADLSFFELVTARAQLRADVQSLAHLKAYVEGVTVKKGDGPLTVDLYMDKGFLGPKSRLEYETPSLEVAGKRLAVESDLKLRLDASGESSNDATGTPLLRSSAETTYLSFTRNDHTFTLQVRGHQEDVALDRIRLSGATKLKRAAIRMPTIVSLDLDDLGALLPEGTSYEARSGELRASAHLDMDQDYQTRGPIDAYVRGAFTLAGVQIYGRTSLRARANINPKLENYLVDSVALSMRKMGMRVGDEDVAGWWMDLVSPRLALWNAKPDLFETTISVRAKDLEPVLEALAEKDQLSDLIPMLTKLGDFRAKATVRTQGEISDVTLESESDVWDISGRLYRNDQQTLMALVVGGQAVSLGIAKVGDDLEIMPFAKTDWLNDRLRRFPEPLEQLEPAKP